MRSIVLATTILFFLVFPVLPDATLDKLISEGKYEQAIQHADSNIPTASRDADIWVKIGQAYEATGLTEKALACFVVSWRMNPNHYGSLIGAAKIYNKMKNFEKGLEMAEKAMDVEMTGEASWVYAEACIALGRPAEAKKALEKVIETDPGNIIANRELGTIYYNDKQFAQAIPLMRKALQAKSDAQLTLKIGQSYQATNVMDSALYFIEKAISEGVKSSSIVIDLARVYYGQKNYEKALEKYNAALSSGKLTADDLYNRAVCIEKVGKPENIIPAYVKALVQFKSSTSENALKTRYVLAQEDFKNKQYDDALIHYKFVAAHDKGNTLVPDIHFLLADVYVAMNNNQQAIASLEKALTGDEKNYEAYARLAQLYENAGMSAKAKQTYETMISISPNDPKVFLTLGDFNLKSKKYQDALDMYVKSNAISVSSRALEGIAVSAGFLNQWNKARDAAVDAVQMDGDRIEARKILVKVYMRGKEYLNAQPHLEYLTDKESSVKNHWIQLAEVYEGLNESEKLAAVDERIITLDSKFAPAYLRLGRYYEEKGDDPKAVENYKKGVVLDPDNDLALKNLSMLLLENNKLDEVVVYLKKYLALKPGDAVAQRNLGNVYYELKKYDSALASYRTVIKLDPTLRGFYKQYADVVIRKGLQSEVIKALTTLIDGGDTAISTYTTLGMIYEKQKNYSKALDIYQKALQKDPQNTDVLSAYAGCQAAKGDVNGAIITYEQTLMMSPELVDEYKALGDLYTKENKTDLAMKAYMTFLDRKPGDQEIAAKVGRYAYSNKEYEKAMKYLKMVKGKAANNFYHMLRLGESSFHAGDYETAGKIFFNLRSRGPKISTLKKIMRMEAESYEKLGKNVSAAKTYGAYCDIKGVYDPEAAYKSASLQEKVNLPAAKNIYNENTTRYPRDYRNFLRLGVIYAQSEETLGRSITNLKKAATFADTVSQVWLEMGKVYGQMGKTDDELKAYREYTKSNPQDPEANKRIGIILMERGETTDAMVYLETANTMKADDPEIIAALAEGYMQTGRQKEAVSNLLKVKNMDPKNTEVRLKLFQCYKDLDKENKAKAEIEELLSMDRDNGYLLMYAYYLYDLKEMDKALNNLENILATDPEDIEALMLKGIIQRNMKAYDEAVETFKEISYIDPNNAQALYERAETHRLMSKPQWANTFYKRALRSDSQYARAELGLAMLAKEAKNRAQYLEHLEKAYTLDPDDKEIRAEWSKRNK